MKIKKRDKKFDYTIQAFHIKGPPLHQIGDYYTIPKHGRYHTKPLKNISSKFNLCYLPFDFVRDPSKL